MRISAILIQGLVATMLGACATTVPFTASSSIPAASGQVKVKETPNHNTSLEVSVKHLAEPQKVAPGATTYVVWTKPSTVQGQAQNVGALLVDRNLSGKLKTITPMKNFEIFITAEPSPMVASPTSATLLSTTIAKR